MQQLSIVGRTLIFGKSSRLIAPQFVLMLSLALQGSITYGVLEPLGYVSDALAEDGDVSNHEIDGVNVDSDTSPTASASNEQDVPAPPPQEGTADLAGVPVSASQAIAIGREASAPPTTAPSEQKVFGTLEIKIREIFEPANNFIYRTANKLKIQTRERMIRREVQFKQGQPYSDFLVYETERLLRQLRYLRDIRVIPIDRGQIVDIVIEVQDTWTIIPQFSFSSGDGRTRKSAGFSEGNLFGYGNRAEILYQEDTGADTVQAAFDSRRLWNSQYQGQLALETGSTGDQVFYDVGDPFRSLAQQQAWSQSSLFSDTIERLYDAAEERFVFRKETNKLGGSYAFALGDPSEEVRRFSMGLSYLSEKFDSANASDLEDVNVDPADLPENGGKLAEDRKFVGPQIGYQYIEQDFVRRNYVDRFSRIQDFNLGSKFQSSVQFAPDFLGSNEDTLLLNTSFGEGYRLANKSFLRWEFEADTRLITQGFENSILSAEAQYIYPIGMLEWGRWFLGNHTFVARTLLDYSEDLDDDVEFLVGGDNMIRGYDARTFTGDKRFALNMEDRIHLVDNIYEFFSLGLAVFADVAGSTRDPLGTLYTNHLYSDVGVGLRIGFPRSNGERVVRIDFAAPLRDGPDGSGALELRILFAGGQLYGARLGTERRAANRVGVDLGF